MLEEWLYSEGIWGQANYCHIKQWNSQGLDRCSRSPMGVKGRPKVIRTFVSNGEESHESLSKKIILRVRRKRPLLDEDKNEIIEEKISILYLFK